jgi:hypothetical protein
MILLAEAREAFDRDDPWWSVELLRYLDSKRLGLAFEWVERCVALLLTQTKTDYQANLQADLDELRLFRQRNATSLQYGVRAREIWFRHCPLDVAAKAVSKLYEAAAVEVLLEPRRYWRTLPTPIDLLLFDVPGRISRLELVLSEFSKLADLDEDGGT